MAVEHSFASKLSNHQFPTHFYIYTTLRVVNSTHHITIVPIQTCLVEVKCVSHGYSHLIEYIIWTTNPSIIDLASFGFFLYTTSWNYFSFIEVSSLIQKTAVAYFNVSLDWIVLWSKIFQARTALSNMSISSKMVGYNLKKILLLFLASQIVIYKLSCWHII